MERLDALFSQTAPKCRSIGVAAMTWAITENL